MITVNTRRRLAVPDMQRHYICVLKYDPRLCQSRTQALRLKFSARTRLEGVLKIMEKKKLRVTFNAPVTLTFVIICFVSLVLGWLTDDFTTDLLFSVYRSSLLSPFTYVRFIGHVFGHASFEHFLANMTTLLLIAPLLEEKYGAGNIIFVILTTALTTGILSFLLFPNVQLLGASGVVFAFILLSSITGVKEGEIPLTFILVAVIYLGEQVVEGILIEDDISNFGHIIGGVCGSVIGYYLNKGKGGKQTPAIDAGDHFTYY